MDPLLFGMALAAGVTWSGLAASFLAWRTGEPVQLGPPHLGRARPLRSLLVCALAGPAALCNEAMRAPGRDGTLLAAAFLVAGAWCVCLGLVLLDALSALR